MEYMSTTKMSIYHSFVPVHPQETLKVPLVLTFSLKVNDRRTAPILADVHREDACQAEPQSRQASLKRLEGPFLSEFREERVGYRRNEQGQ